MGLGRLGVSSSALKPKPEARPYSAVREAQSTQREDNQRASKAMESAKPAPRHRMAGRHEDMYVTEHHRSRTR